MGILKQEGIGLNGEIDHLSTDEELGIEEIDRKQDDPRLPAVPARPVADIPTGVFVSPLAGIVVVAVGKLRAGEDGQKTTNRLQRKGL